MRAAREELQTRGSGLALIGTALPGALLLCLFAVNILMVPAAKRKFDEFAITLPWLTQEVIRASNWVAEYWWATVPFLAVLGVGNYFLLRELGRRNTALPVIWMVAITLVLVAAIGVTLLSIELPMMKLREGLSK